MSVKVPKKIVEELEGIAEKYELSQNQLASKIGISSSVVSQIYSGDYEYNAESFVFIQIEKFIERMGMKIYETKLLKVVENMLDASFTGKKLSVITSESGAGKTVAIEQYCLRNPAAIHVRVNEVFTKKYLLQKLLKACNNDFDGMSSQLMFDSLSDILSRRHRLVVIDEAERLTYNELELMRDLYDQGNIGLVLAGLPKLRQLLQKGRNLRENPVQLYSRVNHQKIVDILEESDVRMIFTDKLNEFKLDISAGKYKSIAKQLVHRGGLRATINLCRDVIGPTAKKNKIEVIDEDFIDESMRRYAL